MFWEVSCFCLRLRSAVNLHLSPEWHLHPSCEKTLGIQYSDRKMKCWVCENKAVISLKKKALAWPVFLEPSHQAHKPGPDLVKLLKPGTCLLQWLADRCNIDKGPYPAHTHVNKGVCSLRCQGCVVTCSLAPTSLCFYTLWYKGLIFMQILTRRGPLSHPDCFHEPQRLSLFAANHSP